jgi:twitching motility protein PilT
MDNNTAPISYPIPTDMNNGNTNQNQSVPEPVINQPIAPPQETIAPKTYVSQPTTLPNLGDSNANPVEENINLVPEEAAPSPAASMTVENTGTARDSLMDIMPDHKGPKALDRKPKPNNLAQPISIEDVQKDNLIKQSLRDINESPTQTQSEPDLAEVVKNNDKYVMQDLLAEVINKNASDLHISVGYPPVIRVDGELEVLGERIITPQDAEELIFEILSDDKKELLEVNREIDFGYEYNGGLNARFRVNAYYSMKNLSGAFRLIPSRVRTLDELMLPQIYRQFAKLKQGLVLVTGPTGHGKSTTLAAILEEINRTRFTHIVTIEDPIEYVFEGKKALIDQREMNDDTHSWEIALRSALRQDPDVILVGEMRDYETIAAAITLAETGHLVFATLHTNSASQTIDRIIDVFPENQQAQVRAQLSNILEAVVAQRLIPLDKGGRRAVSEILLMNPAVGNLIREGKTHQIDNIIRTSSDIGMVSLERSLVNLIREGSISVQKAQEYAVFPEEVLRLLKV